MSVKDNQVSLVSKGMTLRILQLVKTIIVQYVMYNYTCICACTRLSPLGSVMVFPTEID